MINVGDILSTVGGYYDTYGRISSVREMSNTVGISFFVI